MKQKSLKSVLTLLLCSIFSITNAQEAITASGGNAYGDDAIVSYSVGQLVQKTTSGTGGTVLEGVQFFFPSSTLSIIDPKSNINIATYPNPTTSILNLKIDGKHENILSYSLINLQGKLINTGAIKNTITEINISHLPSATYLLKINNGNNTSKTYKIIKN
ncbi:T9SS type A sorting domain-containing protein [Pontimicrobium sp. SW4]|uniref:T9SS type A sorting domain-containing protein n=1 Tax=Pontimicrobium sp. SW4 TaxID=3153519 RepID=A0AAU7BUY1_9FLAO